MLNSFVESFTNFLPTDDERWCAIEPNVINFDMNKVKRLDFDRLGM